MYIHVPWQIVCLQFVRHVKANFTRHRAISLYYCGYNWTASTNYTSRLGAKQRDGTTDGIGKRTLAACACTYVAYDTPYAHVHATQGFKVCVHKYWYTQRTITANDMNAQL